jgi:hypothetical protein
MKKHLLAQDVFENKNNNNINNNKNGQPPSFGSNFILMALAIDRNASSTLAAVAAETS